MNIMEKTDQLNSIINRLHAGEQIPNTEILQVLTWLTEDFSRATNAISAIKQQADSVFAGLGGA